MKQEVDGESQSFVSKTRKSGVAWVLVASLTAAGVLGIAVAQKSAPNANDIQTESSRPSESALNLAWDDSSYHFYQLDPSYSNLPYWHAEGTVGVDGCGLCAYTTMVNLLCGSDYTPDLMLSMRGDWAGQEDQLDDTTGTPDGSTHQDFTYRAFCVMQDIIPSDVNAARTNLSSGNTVLLVGPEACTYHDKYGNSRYSAGHYLCFYRCDDGGFYCHDSAFEGDAGVAVYYTDEQFEELLQATSFLITCTNPTLETS